ncbi:myeloid leukemia factor 2-like, partial [Mustelus asterias]
MSAMFGGFGNPLGFDPFLSITDGRAVTPQLPGPLQHNRRMLQSPALLPFGMFGMGRGGFGDMFGMMNSMFSNINSLMDNVVSGARQGK